MLDITKQTWGKNGVEVIVLDGKKWFNEKHIEEGLYRVCLKAITIVFSRNITRIFSLYFPSEYRKHKYKLVDEPKNQLNRMFLHKDLAVKVIMD